MNCIHYSRFVTLTEKIFLTKEGQRLAVLRRMHDKGFRTFKHKSVLVPYGYISSIINLLN